MITLSPNQTHPNNIFELTENLKIVGSRYPANASPDYFLKKKALIERLLQHPNPEITDKIREQIGLAL